MAGESRTALADRAASAGAPSLADPVALADSAALADPAALADRLRLGLVRLSRQLRRQDPPGLSVTLYSALAAVA
ncbi:MAG: hypothetical protein J2P30_17505, partial [Actinobacteria bacterium]|nr:hypothetical protein [Actinomycetota bacterium]